MSCGDNFGVVVVVVVVSMGGGVGEVGRTIMCMKSVCENLCNVCFIYCNVVYGTKFMQCKFVCNRNSYVSGA